jgi:hypothetical protein
MIATLLIASLALVLRIIRQAGRKERVEITRAKDETQRANLERTT